MSDREHATFCWQLMEICSTLELPKTVFIKKKCKKKGGKHREQAKDAVPNPLYVIDKVAVLNLLHFMNKFAVLNPPQTKKLLC